ncbi:MAG: type I methionyl aminopeptidase [Deltaproteobacteria bacterium]|nr:type I methionyl aminopeptidase [Deltaproteobacteria bacterium]NCP78067.1 type I methionyl aminopeptidase [Desulfuromonadales bacterium]
MISVKSRAELEKMRTSGRMVAEVLALLKEKTLPGVTTLELDQIAEQECRRLKVKPAFKGYGGFPFTICASPNDRVVHGFPNQVPLQDGDIISIDFGLIANGFYGDSAYTLAVGRVSPAVKKLLEITEAALADGISAAVSQGRLSDISHAVQTRAEQHGYGVVRDFVGHGIGRALHEDPQIPNFGAAGQGPKLKPGMTLAVEPMINAGKAQVRLLDDGWTAVTQDGSLSAHFEHTIAITENGPEILTRL